MMEKMENKEIKKKPTAAQIKKKEEAAREKIAMNLDNYIMAVDISLAIISNEGVRDDVKGAANDTLLNTLDKINRL